VVTQQSGWHHRAHVLEWPVIHWQLLQQREQVQLHSQQQEAEQQNAHEGAQFNLPELFAELLDWPSSLLLEVAHPLQKTPLLEIFLLALQLLAIVYLVVSPLFLFLFLLISLPFICVWFLELLFSLVARLFPRWLAKQGHKQPRLQPLPLPLTREQFKTSVSSVKRHARVLYTMVLETLKVHFSSLGSLLLDLLAGHGYKSGRTVIWYLLTIGGFAWAYFHLGPTEGHLFSPSGALVFSVTSFHGRGFFPGTLNLEDTITQLAAEAVIGFFIEISFIATFTQRFFGK
jgi:hypothetical protein